MAAQPAPTLFTTTISQAEILYGVAVLPVGRRRVALQEVVVAIFDKEFFGRVLPFDNSSAQAFAEIAATRRRLGRPIGDFDAQIAAIARSRGAAVATRNVDDFTDCGITVISPWNQ